MRNRRIHRGTTLILAGLLFLGVLVVLALAADLGHVVLVRAGLQAGADAAALAAAERIDSPRTQLAVELQPDNVEYGVWNVTSRTFTPSHRPGNAVRVTAATGPSRFCDWSLLGRFPFASKASAVAADTPRDIALVVDLSGFPPETPPMPAIRRALIAAIRALKRRNARIEDPAGRDWVSIITFDSLITGGPVVRQPLTADYDRAMEACADLRPAADRKAARATEAGMIAAEEQIKPRADGGKGRPTADKVVILLTGGLPDSYSSSRAEIDRFVASHRSDDFYNDGAYPPNAALMQAARMKANGWQVFAVGVGQGTNHDFPDRLARLAGTADREGRSPRAAANPTQCEPRLTEILMRIVDSPKVRLVQ